MNWPFNLEIITCLHAYIVCFFYLGTGGMWNAFSIGVPTVSKCFTEKSGIRLSNRWSKVVLTCGPPGLRLALATILNCRMDASFVLIGLLCSSFVAINRGTNKRFPFNPLGDTKGIGVQIGNGLTSRFLGCLGGCSWKGFWAQENPQKSL